MSTLSMDSPPGDVGYYVEYHLQPHEIDTRASFLSVALHHGSFTDYSWHAYLGAARKYINELSMGILKACLAWVMDADRVHLLCRPWGITSGASSSSLRHHVVAVSTNGSFIKI